MNLDELRTVQNRERQKDSLQHLRDSFYSEVGDYLADLKADRDAAAERADDPFASPEVRRLSDEIQTAEEVAESIYERRMGKVVKNASLAAAGYATDSEGLTHEEERLFENLVASIEENKATVLDVLAGEGSATTADDEASTRSEPGATLEPSSGNPGLDEPTQPTDGDLDAPDSSGVSAASMMNSGDDTTSDTDTSDRPVPPEEPVGDEPTPAPEAPDGSGADDAAPMPNGASEDSGRPSVNGDGPTGLDAGPENSNEGGSGLSNGGATETDDGTAETDASRSDVEDRTTVRITRDVGSIFGTDEYEYELATDDVVALPEANATPLIERDAAEPIE